MESRSAASAWRGAKFPPVEISAISTGGRVPDEGVVWSAKTRLPLNAESAGELIIRSDFDVYLNGDSLVYLKAPCAGSDARGRFFLSVHPADAADLPEDRREIGHVSLNFDFSARGIIFDGARMASRELQDCRISKIATGQWMPGGESLWMVEAAMGD